MSIEIFFCYAREDEELRQGLEKQLKALQRQGLIDIWHNLDEAFFDVAEGIRTAVVKLLFHQANAQGDTYTSTGQFREALTAYEQAIHIDPNNAGVYNSKGITLFELQRHEEALVGQLP